MEMKQGRTLAYHPQCNAQAEVANKSIAKFLKNQVDTFSLYWEIFLPPSMLSYKTLFHRTILTSLFFLTFGQNASQPFFNQDKLHDKFMQKIQLKKSFKFSKKPDRWRGEMLHTSKQSIKKYMTARRHHIHS